MSKWPDARVMLRKSSIRKSMVDEERGRRKVDRLFNDVVRKVRESADRRTRSELVDWIDPP